MALTTLTNLKTDLGITGTDDDTKLTRLIGSVSAAIRAYCKREFGGVITSYTAANPTVVTCPGHGLESGQTITIRRSGLGGATSIDGDRVVTVLTESTFTVPVTVSVASTNNPSGYFTRTRTEYYSGDNTDTLVLRKRPVISISSIYLDDGAYYGQGSDAFAAATLLTEGTDYVLSREDDETAICRSGLVYRINAVWPAIQARTRGLLSRQRIPGRGNIKVTYSAGYPVIPPDLVQACHQWIQQSSEVLEFGDQLQSESLEGYSYSLAQPAGATGGNGALPPGPIAQLLSRYREWVI